MRNVLIAALLLVCAGLSACGDDIATTNNFDTAPSGIEKEIDIHTTSTGADHYIFAGDWAFQGTLRVVKRGGADVKLESLRFVNDADENCQSGITNHGRSNIGGGIDERFPGAPFSEPVQMHIRMYPAQGEGGDSRTVRVLGGEAVFTGLAESVVQLADDFYINMWVIVPMGYAGEGYIRMGLGGGEFCDPSAVSLTGADASTVRKTVTTVSPAVDVISTKG